MKYAASPDRYRAKRNFDRTPEPAAEDVPAGQRLIVQHHLATRDHYDLQLEIGGVLASWAVTRGPSANPKDRQLATRTRTRIDLRNLLSATSAEGHGDRDCPCPGRGGNLHSARRSDWTAHRRTVRRHRAAWLDEPDRFTRHTRPDDIRSRPGRGLAFAEARRAAADIAKVLREIGLVSWPLLSGEKAYMSSYRSAASGTTRKLSLSRRPSLELSLHMILNGLSQP